MPFRISIIIFLFLIIAAGCSSHSGDKINSTTDSSKTTCSKPVFDEYKASELAELMRKMDADFTLIKTALKKREEITLELNYTKIHTATPTDADVRTNDFTLMANAFLESVNRFTQATAAEKENTYSAIITSCVSCHQHFCPGPIKRIEKLKL